MSEFTGGPSLEESASGECHHGHPGATCPACHEERAEQPAARPRLCVDCVHFNIDMGHGPWSDTTPGEDAVIECVQGVWEMRNDDGVEVFRTNIARAKTCPKFEVRK